VIRDGRFEESEFSERKLQGKAIDTNLAQTWSQIMEVASRLRVPCTQIAKTMIQHENGLVKEAIAHEEAQVVAL
jgi:hypothetical protein